MRILFLLLGISCLANMGCATVGKAMLHSIFHSHSDSHDDDEDCHHHDNHFHHGDHAHHNDDVEIDPYILSRKGIEPGSNRHKRLVAEETAYRDFYTAFNCPN